MAEDESGTPGTTPTPQLPEQIPEAKKTGRTFDSRPPAPPPRGPPEVGLSPQELANGVFDLLALVTRVASARDRGLEPGNDAEREFLLEIMNTLARHRDALPGYKSKDNPTLLDPLQESLGRLRLNFDEICKYAASQERTDSRDWILISALATRCAKDPLLFIEGFDLDACIEAVLRVRKRALGELRSKKKASQEWLRGLGESPSVTFTSGEILFEIMEACGPKGLAASRNSTYNYSRRVVEAGEARLLAAKVQPQELLTYFATMFGVPVTSAPLVAFKIACLIQDHRPKSEATGFFEYGMNWSRESPDFPPELRPNENESGKRYESFAPGHAEEYRLLDHQQWHDVFEEMKREFEQHGIPVDTADRVMDTAFCTMFHAPYVYPDGFLDRVVRDHDLRHLSPERFWKSAESHPPLPPLPDP